MHLNFQGEFPNADTSLFSVVYDEATTAQQLNRGFGKGTFMGMAMENGIQCLQN